MEKTEDLKVTEDQIFLTQEDVKEFISYMGYPDSVVFENPDYASAFIGVSTFGNAIYDYRLMVKHLQEEDDMSEDEAMEFIDYNTLRSLPYISSDIRPIVMYKSEDYYE